MRRVAERVAVAAGLALAATAAVVTVSASDSSGGVLTDTRVAVAPTAPATVAATATVAPTAPATVGPTNRPSTPASSQPRPTRSTPPAPTVTRSAAPVVVPLTAADVPVRFTVDGADIDQQVVPTGLADDGSLALPADPATAGWYRFGAWPGRSTGTAVLAAHVNSRSLGAGPMARLPRTRVGALVTVWTAGGRRLHYRVTSVGSAPKTTLPLADLFDRRGIARLALVTCGGSFDAERRAYRDNEIVWALPV